MEHVEAHGFAGGIWVWCSTNTMQLDVPSLHDQASHLKVSHCNGVWCLTAIYGHPSEATMCSFWDFLLLTASQVNVPWLVMGDFNEILDANENEVEGHLIPIGPCDSVIL